MEITDLPRPLPVNLEEIKSLIVERDEEIARLQVEVIDAAQVDQRVLQGQITDLQDYAKKILRITPDNQALAIIMAKKVAAKVHERDINGNKVSPEEAVSE